LASVGRLDEAEKAMAFIEEKVQQSSGVSLELPTEIVDVSATKPTRFGELFSNTYRTRTVVAWVIWFSAYLATYGLTTWLPSIYTSVYRLPLSQALMYSLGTTAAGFVGAFICALLIDRVGRRFWISFASIVAGVLLLVLWFLSKPTALEVLIWSALAYTFTSSVSLTVYLYTPELYPTRMRALGSSVASAWLRVASIIGPLIVATILAQYALVWVFLIFGVVSIIGGIIAAFFATETRERVLEEVSP
jgi:putative MFS transporter